MSRLSSLLEGIGKEKILSSASSASAAAVTIPETEPRVNVMAQALLQARQNALSMDIAAETRESEIEIECRIGLAVNSGEARRLLPQVSGKGNGAVNLQRCNKSFQFRPGTSQLSFRGIEKIARTSNRLTGAKKVYLEETLYLRDNAPRVAVGRTSDMTVELRKKLSERKVALERLGREVVELAAQIGLNQEAHEIAAAAGSLSVTLNGSSLVSQGVLPLETVRCETKQQVRPHFDLGLISCPHDIRLSVQREVPLQVPPDFKAAATSTRMKNRESFQVDGHPDLGAWQLDLTTIITKSNNQESVTSYEVELEMSREGRRMLFNSIEEEAAAACFDLARQLFNWLDLVNHPSDAQDSIGLDALPRGNSSRTAAQGLCKAMSSHGKSGAVHHGLDFCGSMPVNMCKRHLPQIATREYFVTEKTDGVRQLMLVVGSGKGIRTVFVDRAVDKDNNGKSHGLQVRDCPGQVLLPSGSVLDGELVFNLHLRKHVFMVFDALQIGNDNLMSLPWSERVKRLPIDRFKTTHVPNYNGMVVIAKVFWSKFKIDSLLKNISNEGGEHIYRAKAKSQGDVELCHKTDGVIFQPNTPYVCGTDFGLLKWKFTDCITVDLAVQIADGEAKLSCGGDVLLSGDGMATLGFEDTARLTADLSTITNRHDTICEVGMDPSTGEWFYKGIRPDKDRPNALRTVLSTLIELAENVSVEELEWRMLEAFSSSQMTGAGAGGGWAEELQKAESSLLDEIRQRVAAMRAGSKKRKANKI